MKEDTKNSNCKNAGEEEPVPRLLRSFRVRCTRGRCPQSFVISHGHLKWLETGYMFFCVSCPQESPGLGCLGRSAQAINTQSHCYWVVVGSLRREDFPSITYVVGSK